MPLKTLRTIEGSPFAIGEALGQLGKTAMQRLPACAGWASLQPWRGHPHIVALMRRTREVFPDYWDELRGMSEGSGMALDDLFLWHCRSDLPAMTDVVSSSVAINRLASKLVVHSVQADPAFNDECQMVEVRPDGKPGFISLYMPGTLPGHAFGANHAGLVQAVNSLPVAKAEIGIPGAFISRAVLDAASLPDAIDIVMQCERAGAAHHILAEAGEFIMVGIEATPGNRALVPIPGKYCHANHAVNKETVSEAGAAAPASRARQTFLSAVIANLPAYPVEEDVLPLLRESDGLQHGSEQGSEQDRAAPSIRPCNDETATAFFRIHQRRILLDVYRPDGAEAAHHVLQV